MYKLLILSKLLNVRSPIESPGRRIFSTWQPAFSVIFHLAQVQRVSSAADDAVTIISRPKVVLLVRAWLRHLISVLQALHAMPKRNQSQEPKSKTRTKKKKASQGMRAAPQPDSSRLPYMAAAPSLYKGDLAHTELSSHTPSSSAHTHRAHAQLTHTSS